MIITTEDFKSHFTRDFPYLPVWSASKTYFTGDEVYNNLNFYKSKADNNTSLTSDTQKWEVIKDSTDSYVLDTDIIRASQEAELAFNKELFTECKEARIAMLYLTAYYLVVDMKNAMSGLASNGYAGFVASKSVGNVSESYGIPSWVQTNPALSLYLDNGYGKKYLSYLLPRITGFIYLAKGGTTVG